MFDMPGSRARPGSRGRQIISGPGKPWPAQYAKINSLLVQAGANSANEALGVQSLGSVVNINMYGALPSSFPSGLGAIRTAAIQSGAITSSDGGYLQFYTKAHSGADAPTAAMSIDSNQLVNIGSGISSGTATAALYINGYETVVAPAAGVATPYIDVSLPNGGPGLQLGGGGGTPDNTNYYFNNKHTFRDQANGIEWANITGASTSGTAQVNFGTNTTIATFTLIGNNALQFTSSANSVTPRNAVYNPAGVAALLLGGGSTTPDNTNYYLNNLHSYRNQANNLVMAQLSSVANGGFQLTQYTSGYLQTDGSGNVKPNAALFTTLTKSATADVALNSTTTYFSGPSVAQGSSGTWFVTGNVTIEDSNTSVTYVKLWDGTTVIDSGAILNAAGLGNPLSLSLAGVITSPAGNLTIACKDITTTTASMKFNATGNSADCTITAIRIG